MPAHSDPANYQKEKKMAKRPSIYFAIKVVTPRIGKKTLSVETPTIMDPTDEQQEPSWVVETATIMDPTDEQQGVTRTPQNAKTATPSYLSIGEGGSRVYYGVAGHLGAGVLVFTEKEVAQCKSLLEAEQLVKSKHKDWLADAYDWFIFPGHLEDTPPAKPTKAKSAKPAKPAPTVKRKTSPSTKTRGKK